VRSRREVRHGRRRAETHTRLLHQLLGESQAAMRAHDGERGNVPVLHAVGRFFFHLGEDVADNLGGVVGGFWGAGDLFFWTELVDDEQDTGMWRQVEMVAGPSLSSCCLFFLVHFSRASESIIILTPQSFPALCISSLSFYFRLAHLPSLSTYSPTPSPKTHKNFANSHQQLRSSTAASSSHGTDSICKSSSRAGS
jgi:hypothetical protein